MIVWAAIHVVLGMKLRPTWTTYLQTVLITLTWLFVTVRINVLLGTNYGYLLGKPAERSALDLLGPWPGYVAARQGFFKAEGIDIDEYIVGNPALVTQQVISNSLDLGSTTYENLVLATRE